jgi:ABC-type branched-subunit amino acid transport system substrate-binding protein
LNGSKHRGWHWALLGLVLLWGACTSTRSDRRPLPVVLEPSPEAPLGGGERPALSTDDTLSAPKPALIGSRRYAVALLLPFSLDQLSLDQLREKNALKRNRPLVSLGLYEGALLALDSLRHYGVQLDVYVRDTRNSPEVVRRVLAERELQEADLIIGPLFDLELQEALSFARQKGIPLINPLRKPGGQQRYPNLYAVNPGEEILLRQLGADLEQRERRSRVLIVRQDKSEEVALAQAFRSGFRDTLALRNLHEVATDFRLSQLQSHLSEALPNALVVPSRDEVFVNALCRYVSGLGNRYEIRVYGLEEWKKFQSVTPEHYERIHWHYPTHYWPEEASDFSRQLDRACRERFGAPATEYVHTGYDLMFYFGRMLGQYGGKWPAALPPRFRGMMQSFAWQPVGQEQGAEADHMANLKLHVIRFDRYRFVAAP